MFVAIEGIDGSGKSTLVKSLARYYNSRGVETTITREPGGCKEAEIIREIAMSKDYSRRTSTMLMLAARMLNYEENIIHNEGKLVICDRYTYSTIAYQGFAEFMKYREGLLRYDSDIKRLAIEAEPICPDLTILLDIEPKRALDRIRKNNRETDKYDTKGIGYYEQVRKGYMHCVKSFGGEVLCATLPPEDLLMCAVEEIDKVMAKL